MPGVYGSDGFAVDWRPHPRKQVPEVDAELGLVVEDAESGWCGAVVGFEAGAVVLEDRFGKRRPFPLLPAAFLLEGQPVTLRRPARPAAPTQPTRTASGSIAVADAPARVAKASRIWVEGIHDAELVERIWGDDLRVEGVVVEPLGGIDDLPAAVTAFAPGPGQRLGVLVDHFVPGSCERIGGSSSCGTHADNHHIGPWHLLTHCGYPPKSATETCAGSISAPKS